MFGFGMSPKDRWTLEQTEILLTPVAILSGENVKTLAKKIFDETKKEGLARYGEKLYSESNGDRLLNNEAVLGKRLAAGLIANDVRNYWNMPVLMGLIRAKILELSEFIVLDVARQAGKDLLSVARDQRKRYPQYGDPDAWNADLPVNRGFTTQDDNMYPEFTIRVGRWQEKTSADEQAALLSQYTSFNSMVRALVLQGKL